VVLVGAGFLALGMVGFNDQVMPWANHRLATLQYNIAVTKPTFALREQVINEVQPERLYLRAGHIDEATSKLRDVTIYDVSDPSRRRTIIADSGRIALAPNMRDIALTLQHGYILAVPTKKAGELDRIYFTVDHIRVRDVANQFQQTSADSTLKGDREMTVCEMQLEYERASREYDRTKVDVNEAIWIAGGRVGKQPVPTKATPPPGGIGAAYCKLIKWVKTKAASLGPKAAHAEGLPVRAPRPVALVATQGHAQSVEVTIQQTQLDGARLRRDRYGIEIQKKFSLAAACIVLAFVGAPIALRFPRGGVGLVIGVSFTIFALFYVGLVAGESLANKGYMTPFWAMWGANILFAFVGVILYARMGHEGGSGRGDELREWLHAMRLRIGGRAPRDAATP
jgi:lipopolysaccharide export system permease protein